MADFFSSNTVWINFFRMKLVIFTSNLAQWKGKLLIAWTLWRFNFSVSIADCYLIKPRLPKPNLLVWMGHNVIFDVRGKNQVGKAKVVETEFFHEKILAGANINFLLQPPRYQCPSSSSILTRSRLQFGPLPRLRQTFSSAFIVSFHVPQGTSVTKTRRKKQFHQKSTVPSLKTFTRLTQYKYLSGGFSQRWME